MENQTYDFSGWATKANIKCSDGRTIMRDAFEHNDGQTVSLVWNHLHNDPNNVLGHCLLKNRGDGVYMYGSFNDTAAGETAKKLVKHGDVVALSICANKLKQQGNYVLHGDICEVSLVLKGANPGAYIENVIRHGEEVDDEVIIYTGEPISLFHADDSDEPKESTAGGDDKKTTEGDETVKDVWDTLNEKQKTVVYALIGQAISDENPTNEEGGKEPMKHNVFDKESGNAENYLCHADEEKILNLAKSSSVGSLHDAIAIYTENNDTLKHGFEDITQLFPDPEDLRPGAPELITDDQGWISAFFNRCEKSPISRVRTKQVDIRGDDLRASGYKKGKQKKNMGNVKLLKRTTDPQTVYVKDAMHRDDILDITDFDVVAYQYNIMDQKLREELARDILIGDGRDEGDEAKVSEEHIRSIWNDDDLYTIHKDVDIAVTKAELQGSGTGTNFGENYIYAEAIVSAALYSREQYKGSGSLNFFCTPHLLNVMLLARDRNGRRIYDSTSDLAKALNVVNIHTVEKFEGKTRKTEKGEVKKLLGLFVNPKDYCLGAVKGGQITRFNQFDIDFNQQKYLIETRLSGALTRPYSAIALEEPMANVPSVPTSPGESDNSGDDGE